MDKYIAPFILEELLLEIKITYYLFMLQEEETKQVYPFHTTMLELEIFFDALLMAEEGYTGGLFTQ